MPEPRLYGLFIPSLDQQKYPHAVDHERMLGVIEFRPGDTNTAFDAVISDEVRALRQADVDADAATIAAIVEHLALLPADASRHPDGKRLSVRPVDRVVHTISGYVDAETEEGALAYAAGSAEVQWEEAADDAPFFDLYGMDATLEHTEYVTPRPRDDDDE